MLHTAHGLHLLHKNEPASGRSSAAFFFSHYRNAAGVHLLCHFAFPSFCDYHTAKAAFCLFLFYITLHDFFVQFLYTFVAGRTKINAPDYAGCAEVFCIFSCFSEILCRISGVFSFVPYFYTRTDRYIEKADVHFVHLPNFPLFFV